MTRLLDWARVAVLDLRGDLRRFGVLIACLALGTAAIAAVGSVGAGLREAVVRDATRLMGGHIEITRIDRDATPEELSLFSSFGQVTQVVDTNARAVIGEESAFIDLLAVGDNYPLLGNVISPELPTGEKPAVLLDTRDGVFGAIVEPAFLERLGADVGAQFTIGPVPFEVRGTLTALPDGAVRGFHLGVTTVISTTALQSLDGHLRPPLPGLLTQHRYKIVLDAGRTYEEAANAVALTLDPDWRSRSPRDAAGELARYYDLFTRFLLIVGLSSLLVGGIGVSTGVSAYIAERQQSIAVMRSLGATGRRVLLHFMLQVGVLTLVGVGIGVLVGAASSAVALPFIGRALSVELPASIDATALLVAGGFGVLAGFAFSYMPLLGTRRVSPALLFRSVGAVGSSSSWRELLRPALLLPLILAGGGIYALAVFSTGDVTLVNAYALGAAFTFALLRVLAGLLQGGLRLVRPSRTVSVRHAVRHIHLPGSTAPVVIVSLGLGLSMVLLIALLNSNLRTQILGAVSADAPTFVATDLFDNEVAEIQEMAAGNPAFAKFEARPSIRARVLSIAGRDASGLRNLGSDTAFLLGSDLPVTWRSDMPTDGTLVAGEWWSEDYEGPPLISLRSTMQEELGLKVGDKIVFDLFGDEVEATIANFRDYQWQNGMNFFVIFSPGEIEFYPATYLGSIKAASGQERDVERAITQAFPEVAFIPIGEVLQQALNLLGQLATGVNIVGSLAVINGLLVLAGTMAVGRKQREHDATIHKVLGSTRTGVLWEFTLEYALLGAFAALVAALVAIGAAWAITRSALDVNFVADPVLVGMVLVGAVLLTIVAGAATTWKSLSTPPARFLRSKEA